MINVCHDCGETFSTPKEIDTEVSVETHPDGSKDIHTEPTKVSPCCGEDFEQFEDNT